MNRDDRVDDVLDRMLAARKAIDQATTEPDNVKQRRLDVIAAAHLRSAADALDDEGRFGDE